MKHVVRFSAFVLVVACLVGTVSAKDRASEDRVSDTKKPTSNATNERRAVQSTSGAVQSDATPQATSPVVPDPAPAQKPNGTRSPLAGEQINWWVIGAGGGSGTSANFQLSGTIGQPAVGMAGSASFDVNQGYWQDFGSGSSGCCIGSTGNVNADAGDAVDLSDLIYLVNYLFLGGPAPTCPAEANTNGDVSCAVDLSDLIYLVNYLFLGGPAPAACLPGC